MFIELLRSLFVCLSSDIYVVFLEDEVTRISYFLLLIHPTSSPLLVLLDRLIVDHR